MIATVPVHCFSDTFFSEVFKILHKLPPSYLQDLLKENVSLYDFRNKRQVEIPQVNPKIYGMKSFRFEAAQAWNSLPNEVRLAENYKQFRKLNIADLGWGELQVYFMLLLTFGFSICLFPNFCVLFCLCLSFSKF